MATTGPGPVRKGICPVCTAPHGTPHRKSCGVEARAEVARLRTENQQLYAKIDDLYNQLDACRNQLN